MKKRLTDGYAQIPNNRILDGTLSQMSVAEIRIYCCMSMWLNESSNTGTISNKAIGRYCNITSGKRIQEAIHALEHKHKMIQTWVVPKLTWEKRISGHTVRHYKLQEAGKDEQIQNQRKFYQLMQTRRR